MALWGKHETMALIQLYRAKACLWKVTDPDYRHHSKRKLALNDIASKMQNVRPGITDKEVQAKINGLRTQYSDQLRKQHKMRGSGGTYTKVLWCFNALQFLRHFVVPRHISGNCHAEEDVEGDVTWEGAAQLDDNDLIVAATEDITSGRRNHTSTDVITPRKCKRSKTQSAHAYNVGGMHRVTKRASTTSGCNAMDDNFALFGAYIASELRSLKNPTQQHLAQMDIQRVIFKRKCPLLRISSDRSSNSSSSSRRTSLKMEPKSPSVSGDAVQDSFANCPLPPTLHDDGSVAQYCMTYFPM